MQVEASAKEHLAGMTLDAIFHSGVPRTHDSAQHVKATLNLTCPVVPFPAFGLEELNARGLPRVSIDEARKRINKPHAEATVNDWLQSFSWVGGYLRGQTRFAIASAVLYIATNPFMKPKAYPVNVLVVGHSPALEMATATPIERLSLNEADIIRYAVELDLNGFVQVTCEMVYRCPPVV